MKSFPPPLSPGEEQYYMEQYAAGDPDARRILIEHNLRLVAHVMKKYQHLEEDPEDLISIGTIGLIKAVSTFCPGKNTRFATYACRCIENAILSRMRLWFQTNTPRAEKNRNGAAPDRLRWCRHHMGLMQKEVAELIGISRGHYIDFEVGYVDCYPKEIVDKLAALYKVPVDDLLDDYNRFLYKGQGKMTREYRESLGMKKKPFARMIHLDPGTLRIWENDEKVMFKKSWEKYFKDIIKV